MLNNYCTVTISTNKLTFIKLKQLLTILSVCLISRWICHIHGDPKNDFSKATLCNFYKIMTSHCDSDTNRDIKHSLSL
jgi:hypothetical protein